LKQKLCEYPILAHPDFNQPFQLYTDASTVGLGAILSQIQNGKETAYASRTLNAYEKNYGITELECHCMGCWIL
jgi:hypothetical protein